MIEKAQKVAKATKIKEKGGKHIDIIKLLKKGARISYFGKEVYRHEAVGDYAEKLTAKGSGARYLISKGLVQKGNGGFLTLNCAKGCHKKCKGCSILAD